jgi:hypothetical protein
MPSQFSDKAGKPPAGVNRRELFLRGVNDSARFVQENRLGYLNCYPFPSKNARIAVQTWRSERPFA